MTKEWVIEMIFDKQKNTIQILWRQNPVFSLMSQWEVKQSKINSIPTHAHVLFSISFPFLVSWIACLNASSSNHKGNWRHLVFSSVHFSSECKYLLYPFWKKFRQRRIWQAINTIISYAKLFRNEIIQLVMMSLYNIASIRDRVRPQGVYMETEKFQLFTRFQFPSYVSIKSKLQYPPADKPLGIWAF